MYYEVEKKENPAMSTNVFVIKKDKMLFLESPYSQWARYGTRLVVVEESEDRVTVKVARPKRRLYLQKYYNKMLKVPSDWLEPAAFKKMGPEAISGRTPSRGP